MTGKDSIEPGKVTGAAIVANSDISIESDTLSTLSSAGGIEEIADERHEEIVLDHALAKSSNVTSPAEEMGVFVETEVKSEQKKTKPNRVENEHVHRISKDVESTDAISIPKKQESLKIIDLEDDFFAMNYDQPLYPRVKRKKRQKKKSDISATPSFETTQLSTTSSATSATENSPIVILTDEEEEEEDLSIVEITEKKSPSVTLTPSPKRKVRRPITPPAIDEATFKAEYRRTHSLTEDPDPIFSGMGDTPQRDEFDLRKRLALLDKLTIPKPSISQPAITADSHVQSQRSSTEDIPSTQDKTPETTGQKVRVFTVNVTSFLPGTNDLPALSLQVKGNKKFSTIVSKVLSYLKGLGIIPETYLHLYEESQIVLFWNKVRLMTFMKLDTLNIPEPIDPNEVTEVAMSIYTYAQAKEIQENERLAKQRKLEQVKKDEELERLLQAHQKPRNKDEDLDDDPFKYEEHFKEVDSRPIQDTTPVAESLEDSEYFKIHLKGEDNKKVTCEVKPDTKISDMVNYYLQQKELPLNTNARLVFDDEDLKISGTVAGTELEDDFCVDVYIL